MNAPLDSAIVHALLKAQPEHLSGAELADDLGVSRVTVKSRVDRLKAQGLEVDAVRNRGYCLKSLPKTLHPAVLEALLTEQKMTAEFRFFETIDSTNTEAERQLAQGCPTPLVIAAGHQSKGRGRLGRVWFSEDPGNLYLSFVFRPLIHPGRMQRFTLWMGSELCAELNDAFDLPVRVKWPNDLVADGRKIAGILTEARIDADHTRDVVLGCGINVNSKISDWPVEVQKVATSLSMIAGQPLDLNSMATALICRVLKAYDLFIADRFADAFQTNWERFSALDGQEVVANGPQGEFRGRAEGIDDGGALLLRDADGNLNRFQAGDVSLSQHYG